MSIAVQPIAFTLRTYAAVEPDSCKHRLMLIAADEIERLNRREVELVEALNQREDQLRIALDNNRAEPQSPVKDFDSWRTGFHEGLECAAEQIVRMHTLLPAANTEQVGYDRYSGE